jgi:hypothetical protein
MTTITIDRATVEQALEALQHLAGMNCDHSRGICVCEYRDAANNLSAALAQQAEPVQEPVGDKLVSAAGLALEALQKDRQFAANAGRVFSMLSVRAIEELQEAFRELRTQQAEPVDTDCHTQGICQRSGYGIPKP